MLIIAPIPKNISPYTAICLSPTIPFPKYSLPFLYQDTKNIYMYMEGLVHVPKFNFKLAEERWEIRHQIIREKIGYFEKNKEYKALCNEDQVILDKEEKGEKHASRKKRYPGIIRDPVEFWKYMMNEGMMHFLTDAYDERIDEIENEHAKESTLADEYSIIKTNMMKLR